MFSAPDAKTLSQEILRIYSLLFSRTPASRRIAKRLFRRQGIEVEFKDNIVDEIRASGVKPIGSTTPRLYIRKWEKAEGPTLADFQHFRPQLAFLKNEMDDWKPQRFTDVFISAYRDLFTWYSTMFAVAIGVLGIISVITSILQTEIAYQGLDIAREALELQKNQTPSF
jgi:hypothetical protein